MVSEEIYFDKNIGVLVQFEYKEATNSNGSYNNIINTLRNSTVFTDATLPTSSPTLRNTNSIVPTITPAINEFPSGLDIATIITATLLGTVVIKRKQSRRRTS